MKKEKQFIDIGSLNNKEEIYRITFSCCQSELETICDEIQNFGEIIKKEMEKEV